MSYSVLAISTSHNSSLCLIVDGVVEVMYSCERTSREKDTPDISQDDINYIATITKLIDVVVLVNVSDRNTNDPKSPNYEKREPRIDGFYRSTPTYTIEKYLKSAGITYKQLIIDNSNHHLYHAAAGVHTSGFNESLCLVLDGVGTVWQYRRTQLYESTTLFYANNEGITTIYKHLVHKPRNLDLTGWNCDVIDQVKKTFSYPVDISRHIDIGKMYGTITRHIGFRSAMQAGKTMGLAAYGQPNNLPPMLIGDSIVSDANFFGSDSEVDTFVYPQLKNPDEVMKQNLAYNVQKAAELIFVKRVEQALSMKPCNNLVIGGGCALNILANSVIKKRFPNLNIFVEPIASDASQSLGAALHHYKRFNPNVVYNKMDQLYLGPKYDTMHIKTKLYSLVEQYNNESTLPVNVS